MTESFSMSRPCFETLGSSACNLGHARSRMCPEGWSPHARNLAHLCADECPPHKHHGIAPPTVLARCSRNDGIRRHQAAPL